MKIHFTKMHGIGNDYIYINCMGGMDFDPSDLAVKMSPRHFSVGADGRFIVSPIRFFATSTDSTHTVTTSPTFSTSDG